MCHKSQLNGHLHLEIVDRKAKKKRVEGQTSTGTTAEKQIHSHLVLETKQQNDKMPPDTAATQTETEMRTASQGRCQALKLSGLYSMYIYIVVRPHKYLFMASFAAETCYGFLGGGRK